MKLQRTTWGLVIAAMALGGFVYVLEVSSQVRQQAVEAKTQKIFDFTKEQIERITIEQETDDKKKADKVVIEATGKEEQPWQLKEPDDVPAKEPVVSFFLSVLLERKRDRVFLVPPSKLADYGLEKAVVTITIKLKDEEKPHIILLGKPNFDQTFVYARIDPKSESDQDEEITLVPMDLKNALDRKLSEWKETSPDE